MVSLGGVTLNVSDDKKKVSALKKTNPIAGYSRVIKTNIGLTNNSWTINGYVKSEAAYKQIEALVGTSGLTFIDKWGDSYTNVSIDSLDPLRKNHDFIKYTLIFSEDI